MSNLTIELFIDYMYNRFLIIFFICLAGSLVHDVCGTIKNLSKIEYMKDIISALFSAIVLSTIIDIVNWNFSLCVLVCFLTGIYSFKLLELALNWKVMKSIVLNILKQSKGIVGEAIVKTSEELETEIDDTLKDKEESESNTETKKVDLKK